MNYTFELVFKGLCLFLLQGDGQGYSGVDVALVNAMQERPSSCEADVMLPVHVPNLVFEAPDKAIRASRGDLSRMGCSGSDVTSWSCALEGQELCLRLPEGAVSQFAVASGRSAGSAKPANDAEARAFDWIAHLERLDQTKIARPKAEVHESVVNNSLVTSRIRIRNGQLATRDVVRSDGEPFPLSVVPTRSSDQESPKSFAEEIVLRIDELNAPIRLESCEDPGFWWEFAPRGAEQVVSISVENEPLNMGSTMTTRTANAPNRLLHFLWFFELLEWKNGVCPDVLVAPECPDGNCRGEPPPFILPSAGNHFCPPASYP